MTKKLSRKEIKAALEQTPIENILLGHQTGGVKLTAKQKEFARQVAEGKPKAEAYRNAYPNNMTKDQQAVEGHKLANSPKVQNMIDAFKLANEANKYLLPAHLRALAVQRLTELAISEDVKPAQQLKALELIGKITEVALFTERREVIKVTDTAEAKAKLIESLKLAMRSGNTIEADFTMAADAKAKTEAEEADSLLAEIAGHDDTQAQHYDASTEQTEAEDIEKTSEGVASTNGKGSTPPHPDPLKRGTLPPPHLHSIPHTESPTFDKLSTESHSSDESLSPSTESTKDA